MKSKKSGKADLERNRSTFFLIGLVLTLLLVLMAFEWPSKTEKVEILQGKSIDAVEDLIIPIVREPKETPPAPKPVSIDFVKIVPNENAILNEWKIDISEPTDITPIEFPKVAEPLPEEKEEEIFTNYIDVPAAFPGGERALYKYISDQVRYPVIAQENGVQGKVYVQFVVDEKGNVVNAHVSRPGDNSLDIEALRVINSLPQFKPGMQNGRFVKVYYTAVINFQLQ